MGYTFGVGREAPGFTLASIDGGMVSLRDYRGDWFPVLVFFDRTDGAAPSALTGHGSAADRLWGLRGQPLGITVGELDDVAAFAESTGGVAFPLLADARGDVARLYAAWDAKRNAVAPATVIVDRAGKIVWMGRGSDASAAATLAAFQDVVR